MLSRIKFTILSENRVENPDFIAEQGLAIFIETPEGNLLFDTGQMNAILHNAPRAGIDLHSLSAVFLSHGHFDLTGGLRHLMTKVHPLDIYCHPNLFNKKYRIVDGEKAEIGVPWEKSELEEKGAVFHLKTRPKEILPDVWLSGEIPRVTPYEKIDETYQERILESYIHDELHDDMALIIKARAGLIVLLGCGHAGPINTLKHAMRIMGENRILAVMGGMHLSRAPEEKITKIVTNLVRLNPAYLIPLHCCGFRAITLMYHHFRDRLRLLNVGDSFAFPE